ncbi:hypothetical protein I4U23_023756 [Adineta vaga]|nr:hypothetical protein I4U23_023756 [Adineta vaga]
MGKNKTLPESVGEVHECSKAKFFLQNDRSEHILMEQWNLLRNIGIITAFYFPYAVFRWDQAIAVTCTQTALLTSIATTKMIKRVLTRNSLLGGLSSLTRAGADWKIRLFDKAILQLRGNNCTISMGDAEFLLAIPAVAFAAVRTAEQNCTATRRLIVQKGIYDEVSSDIRRAYEHIESRIGEPCEENVNVNIPTSDAEIGRAFGEEKYTGRERQFGSDSWKQYMRQSTCKTNYSKQHPLTQEFKFA